MEMPSDGGTHKHHVLSVTHTRSQVGPPAGCGGVAVTLRLAGRQLQMTVAGPLPGGSARQDGV